MNETVLYLNREPVRTWLAVTTLGISAFSIVTSELAPVGMLNLLAQDLHRNASDTGLVVTAYGWVAALAALIAGAIPARLSRRTLLIGLMFILALSCIAVTRTQTLPTFMAARMTGAFAHGAFWALIGSVAVQLVPPQKLGLATAVIFGGVSAASVLGVPLASFVADVAGWRNAFMGIALLSLAAAIALSLTLPALTAEQVSILSVYRRVLTQPLLLGLYAATACIITAHFAAFTYLDPLLTQYHDIPVASVSGLLLVSGLAGLAGNFIAGRLIDRHLRHLVLGSLLLSSLSLGLLSIHMMTPFPMLFTGLFMALWASGIAIVFVGLQTWLLRSAGKDVQPASAIYVAIFNAAIGTGALVGGTALAAFGLPKMVLLAAAIILAGAGLVARLACPQR